MKITRIKVCNLASLAGVAELDLKKGALAQAGLFAITGPTGSGKTTLLDAVCLALFDQTPRLQEASGVKIGRPGLEHDALSAQSPRSLLRHDAGSGYAEVDFESTEGRPFCARWEVRRAGDKPSGRLQSQKMSLKDLTTHQVMGSGTKTETKALIVEHLGLNFDQFTRSALLAQGQFASFLKAKRGERAELLERMTGTDLYARISVQAFLKNKEAKEALQALETQKNELNLLTPVEIAAKRGTLNHTGEEVAALEGLHTARALHAEWELRVAGSSKALEAAKIQVAVARQNWDKSSAERARLERYEGAALQLERLAQLKAARSKVVLQQAELADCRSQLLDFALAQKASGAQLQIAQEGLKSARETSEELSPKIQRAQALERQALAAKAEQTDAQAQLEQAKTDLSKIEGALAALKEKLHGSQAHLSRAQEALAADAQAAALTAIWPRVRKDLGTASEIQLRLSAGDGLQAELDALTAQEGLAQTALNAARGTLESVRERLRDHRATAPTELDEQRKELARLESLSIRVQAQEQLITDLKQRIADALEERQVQEKRVVALTKQEEERKVELPLAEASARDSARLRELGASTLALEQHRHLLVPGEACPLCGSPEHPGVDPSSVVIGALEQQERAARETVDALKLSLQKCTLAKEQALEAQQKAQAQHAAMLPDLTQASARHSELLNGFADPQALSLRIDTLGSTLKERERAAATWRVGLKELELELASTESALHAAELAAAQCSASVQGLKAQAQARARDTQALELVQARLLEDLAELPALSLARLAQSPGELLADWEQRVPQAQAHMQAQLEGERELLALQVPLATAKAEQASLVKGHALAEKLVQKRTLALRQLSEAQLALGVPDPERAAEELQLAVLAASQSFEAAKEHDQDARRAHALADQRLAAALLSLENRSKELEENELALKRSMGELSLDALKELQAWDDTARQAATFRRSSFKEALHSSVAILSLREQELERLRSEEPESAAVDPSLPPLEERLKQTRTRFLELELELKEQEKRAGQSQTLISQIAEHIEATRRWAVLDKLIGSSEGDLFRRFAQGLTLESLLAHANGHLGELAPRYLLARVPDQDLELQIVDQAMAGDVRSVNSLSGGETFLVSLALALGLASLSASQTPVRTLFIDEGFGSLDPKSLDTALATLDALQAGGRQVGIISHVAGIGDHIGVQVRIKPIGPGKSQVLLP